MSILDCVADKQGKSTVWYISMLVLGCLFSLILVLCLGATIVFFGEVRSQRRIVTVAQVFLILAFATKAISFLLSGPMQSAAGTSRVKLYGLILFETPCYIITTCYSLTLLSWLSVCLAYLPDRYQRFASRAHQTVIGVNIAIYIAFVVDLFLEGCDVGPVNFQTGFSTGVIVLRDMAMGLAFLVFLRCGFGVSNFSSASSPEKRLFLLNVTFASVLILRAAVVIVQEIVSAQSSDECSMGFYSVFMVNELVIDYVPLSILAFLTYSHLINKSSLQIVQVADASVVESHESFDGTSLLKSI